MMMGPLGGTAIGVEAMEVRVGGGGVIVIGATTGDGATTAMIGAEAITAEATTGMIAGNIVGDEVTAGTS